MDETSESYWRRHQEAEAFTTSILGPAPKGNAGAVAIFAFFATSFPAYCALLLAGYNGDKLQIPLISIRALSAAAAYAYVNSQSSKWHKAHQQRMSETAPPNA